MIVCMLHVAFVPEIIDLLPRYVLVFPLFYNDVGVTQNSAEWLKKKKKNNHWVITFLFMEQYCSSLKGGVAIVLSQGE